jgi:hypothetical protein
MAPEQQDLFIKQTFLTHPHLEPIFYRYIEQGTLGASQADRNAAALQAQQLAAALDTSQQHLTLDHYQLLALQ